MIASELQKNIHIIFKSGIALVKCARSFVVKTAFFILSILGRQKYPIRVVVGRFIGMFIYWVSSKRRAIARRNLLICFGTDNSMDQELMVRQCFHEVGLGLLEMGRAWNAPKAEILNELELDGEQLLVEAKADGKGILILCPHYTSLELAAPFIEAAIGRLVISYRPHELNDLESVLKAGRSRYGDLINVRSIRSLLKTLKNGDVLWFGPDQDMGSKGSVFAPFFGHPASTVTTPSWLAKKTECAVFFLAMIRSKAGYEVRFIPMPEGYPFEDEVRNATILNGMIESALQEHPAQYMWMHKRFKTQPHAPRYSIYQ